MAVPRAGGAGAPGGATPAVGSNQGPDGPPHGGVSGEESSFNVLNVGLKGVPAMEVLVRYERSWSIQDALDQHAALAEQREVLLDIGRNRLRVRQTQLSLAELEAQNALKAAKGVSPLDASNAMNVLQLASHVRSTVRDLRMAARLKKMEQAMIHEQLALAEAEIERSRQEMTSMKEVIDDKSLMPATDDTQAAADSYDKVLQQRYKYCTNCKVGGHGQRFCEYFLERPDWRVYPNQKWFEDEKSNVYHCPLGKKVVNFADESHFSRIAMYIKGRAWLEEKTKVMSLAEGFMPVTYIVKDGVWDGAQPPPDDQVSNLPWFVKEADRNWGTSVHVCARPSECLALCQAGATYVVQQHIEDPLLMDDGRKCHIKFYVFLMCMEDGMRWRLYTFKEGYLSISPNKWTPDDLSKDTQVTIIRTERIGHWKAWDAAYPKCRAAVAKVMDKAVAEGKLEGRLGKKQFEILSADFMVDNKGDVWLFEFNMSPVLKDAKDAPLVNDAAMIRGALSIVCPWDQGGPGEWDFVDEFLGKRPEPSKVPPSDAEGGAEAAASEAAPVAPPDGKNAAG